MNTPYLQPNSNPSEGPAPMSPDATHYSLRVPAYASQLDESGQVEAGIILKLIDVAGFIPAKQLVGKGLYPVTASMDRTDFLNPVLPWNVVVLDARVTQVWRSAIESRVVVSTWDFQSGEILPIATSYLVFVARDIQGHKLPEGVRLPKLLLNTPEAEYLAKMADVRKKYREQEGIHAPVVPINPRDPHEQKPVIIAQQMAPHHANAMNKVFGGVILAMIHKAGAEAAENYKPPQVRMVCVRQDRVNFLQPAHIGDLVRAMAVVTRTWKTSLEVQVEVSAIDLLTGESRLAATSYLVYVAIDESPDGTGKPLACMPFEPRTEAQRQRAESAQTRRAFREAEKRRGQLEGP